MKGGRRGRDILELSNRSRQTYRHTDIQTNMVSREALVNCVLEVFLLNQIITFHKPSFIMYNVHTYIII